MADWWNDNYAFRRNLKITPVETVLAGYPIFVSYPTANIVGLSKARPDLADIEVLYLDDNDNWNLIGSSATISDSNVIIKFNAVQNISSSTLKYFVYMGNPNLTNQPVAPAYEDSDYVIDTSTTGGIGLSFTRPTEDWDSGLSLVNDARAAFGMLGVNAKVTVEKGPDRGIMELSVDYGVPVYIDTYSSSRANTVVYTTSGLSVGRHYIRMRATGYKSPSSTSSAIKIVKVQYSRYTEAVDQGETINTNRVPIRIVVGP